MGNKPVMIDGLAPYAVVNVRTGGVGYMLFGYSYEEGQECPGPTSADPEIRFVPLAEVLGQTPIDKFVAGHRPRIEGGEVVGWDGIQAEIQVEVRGQPLADGSQAVDVVVTGPANASFTVDPSQTAVTNLKDGQGVFDAQGRAQFKLKVVGSGPYSLSIRAPGAGFQPHVVTGRAQGGSF